MTLEIVLWPLHTCTHMHPNAQEHAHTCICPHVYRPIKVRYTEWGRSDDCSWGFSATWACGHIMPQYGNHTEYHLKLVGTGRKCVFNVTRERLKVAPAVSPSLDCHLQQSPSPWGGNDRSNESRGYGCLDGGLSTWTQRLMTSIPEAPSGGDKDSPLGSSPLHG